MVYLFIIIICLIGIIIFMSIYKKNNTQTICIMSVKSSSLLNTHRAIQCLSELPTIIFINNENNDINGFKSWYHNNNYKNFIAINSNDTRIIPFTNINLSKSFYNISDMSVITVILDTYECDLININTDINTDVDYLSKILTYVKLHCSTNFIISISTLIDNNNLNDLLYDIFANTITISENSDVSNIKLVISKSVCIHGIKFGITLLDTNEDLLKYAVYAIIKNYGSYKVENYTDLLSIQIIKKIRYND